MALTEIAGTEPFLTADVSVAINTGASPQSMSTNRNWLDVRHCDDAAIYVYAKGGNASCSLMADYYFQVATKSDAADAAARDLPVVSLALNGTSMVTADAVLPLDCRGIDYIRLDRVGNNESTAGYTATVQAHLRRNKRA